MERDTKLDNNDSLRNVMMQGSAWMVAMRWVMGGIGLISMVILARLLEPKDFGLIAMSMLFIGLLNILTSFGADMALIQRRDPTREHFDAAWTVRLLQTIGVAICVVIIAPFVADYFDESRVTAARFSLATRAQ